VRHVRQQGLVTPRFHRHLISSAIYHTTHAACGRLPDAIKHMVVRELEIHSSAVHPNIIQLYAAFEVRRSYHASL
jgi:hypothetical protein